MRNISRSKGKVTEILSRIRASLHVKNFLFSLNFNENRIFLTDFRKSPDVSNFMKIRPVRAVFFYTERQTDAQADRQTDRCT